MVAAEPSSGKDVGGTGPVCGDFSTTHPEKIPLCAWVFLPKAVSGKRKRHYWTVSSNHCSPQGKIPEPDGCGRKRRSFFRGARRDSPPAPEVQERVFDRMTHSVRRGVALARCLPVFPGRKDVGSGGHFGKRLREPVPIAALIRRHFPGGDSVGHRARLPARSGTFGNKRSGRYSVRTHGQAASAAFSPSIMSHSWSSSSSNGGDIGEYFSNAHSRAGYPAAVRWHALSKNGIADQTIVAGKMFHAFSPPRKRWP